MMINTILFDMDGVITDTEKLHYVSWKKAFKKVDHSLTFVNYVNNLQSRNREVGIKNELKNPSPKVIQLVSDYKTVFYDELIKEEIRVFSDAIEIIKYFYDKGYILAVVSSSSYAKKIIHSVSLEKYFKLIIAGTKKLEIRNKPNPDIYLYAMEKLNVSSENCLVIEDSMSGVTAGCLSKAKVVYINRENQKIDVQNPYFEVTNLKQIKRIDLF